MTVEIDDLEGIAQRILLEPPLEESQLRELFIRIGMDAPSRIERFKAILESRIEDKRLSIAAREEAKRQLEALPCL